MSVFQQIAHQPQRIWLRRALFQIHLWTGIGVGLYVLVISITGSVVIFRNELYRAFTVQPVMVAGQGAKLTDDELKTAAEKAHPGFTVANIFRSRRGEQAVEIWMENESGEERRQRNFHPYTGADLGNSIPPGIKLTSWLIDLHDNLLGGDTGRLVNGVGGIFLTVLCITGAVIWWPGLRSWRRSLTLHRKVGWKRFNWDLHNVLGVWFFAFIFIWGVSGIYLAFPNAFNIVVDFLEPLKEDSNEPRFLDDALVWLGRLHFGRFYGMPMKIAWAFLGLIPPILFVTGAVMWWNRVLKPSRNSQLNPEIRENVAESGD